MPVTPHLPAPVYIIGPNLLPPRPLSRSSSGHDTDIVRVGDLTVCRATCFCRRCDFRVAFLSENLPIKSYICNCTSCRHNIGQMGFCSARIVGEPIQGEYELPFDTGLMSSYKPHDRIGVERFFCPTCSCNMLVRVDITDETRAAADRNNEPYDCGFGRTRSEPLPEAELRQGWGWRVASGALRISEGIIQPVYHLNVASTMDGGLADHMRKYDGVELIRYSEGIGSEEIPFNWRSPLLKEEQPAEHSAYCHCRTISVKFSRPSEIATDWKVPFPDLFFPTDITLRAKQRNIHGVNWWSAPPFKDGKPTRYVAGYCGCPFCRSTGGFENQAWIFVPRAHIWEASKTADDPIDFFLEDRRPKGLKQYVSSPGRYREFCGTCGATAFWWHAGREELIDISVGMLDASVDGVKAHHWLKWHKQRVSRNEISPSPKIMESLRDGLQYEED